MLKNGFTCKRNINKKIPPHITIQIAETTFFNNKEK